LWHRPKKQLGGNVARYIARLICICVGCVAGWEVYINLSELFKGFVPLAIGLAVAFVVFLVLYFPLGRHIADYFTDRFSVAIHRGRHIRAGTGIDHIPDAPPAPSCSICGAPDGPICRECNEKMSR
jgi:hypothetical protein